MIQWLYKILGWTGKHYRTEEISSQSFARKAKVFGTQKFRIRDGYIEGYINICRHQHKGKGILSSIKEEHYRSWVWARLDDILKYGPPYRISRKEDYKLCSKGSSPEFMFSYKNMRNRDWT